MDKQEETASQPGRDFSWIDRELSDELRMLNEAMMKQETGLDGLMAVRPLLVRLLGRILRLQEQIDAAFGGQLFDRNYALLAPANTQRVNAFLRAHERADRLMARAIELWTLTCGVRWECNSQTCAAHNCPKRGKRSQKRQSVAAT